MQELFEKFFAFFCCINAVFARILSSLSRTLFLVFLFLNFRSFVFFCVFAILSNRISKRLEYDMPEIFCTQKSPERSIPLVFLRIYAPRFLSEKPLPFLS